MTDIDTRRREALIADVARTFLALDTRAKAALLVGAPDLYFAAAHLTRFEGLTR